MRLAKKGHGDFVMDVLQEETLNYPCILTGPHELQSPPTAVYAVAIPPSVLFSGVFCGSFTTFHLISAMFLFQLIELGPW